MDKKDGKMDAYLQNNRELWDMWTHLHLETDSDYQKDLALFP